MDKEIVKSLPKVELHCHLDGSVPLETLYQLAEKENIRKEEMLKAIAPKKCLDLKEYLASFDYILSVLQSANNLEIASFSVVNEAKKENVKYMEIRFAPLLHTQQGLSPKEVIKSVCSGVRKAQRDGTIKISLLICGMRHHTNKENTLLLKEVKDLNEELVVGFDYAGDEKELSNDTIGPVVSFAKNMDLRLTLHSGECGCAQNVVEAIKLGTERIGHGVAIRNNEEAMKLCKEKNILLELCPTSNIQTNAIYDWNDYPIKDFLKRNIKCCVNTDNRTVSQTTLTNEFLKLYEHCNLTYTEMQVLTSNAIRYSFADPKTKSEILEEIDSEFSTITNG